MAALAGWIKRTSEMTAPEIIPVEAGHIIDLNHDKRYLRLRFSDLSRSISTAKLLYSWERRVYLAARKIFFDEDPVVTMLNRGRC